MSDVYVKYCGDEMDLIRAIAFEEFRNKIFRTVIGDIE